MKYYLIAGEASGDLHGANLMHALKKTDKNAQFRFWGGEKMASAGGTQVEHYKNTAFMGFLEVVLNLRTIFKFLAQCKQDILNHQPDVLILIDYPGFNLRIAEWAKQNTKAKIVYYISPQVWAWKENRVKKIKQTVDKMLVILPFEKAFYQKHNYQVEFVGHPLLDEIDKLEILPKQPQKTETKQAIIALLPGSRKQEIKKMLPVFLQVVPMFPKHKFVVAGLAHNGKAFYNQIIGNLNVSVEYNNTYKLLSQAQFAVVTSGTATLETALFKVPMVVCYKGSWLSYQIGKRLVKINFIALVNLIMNKAIVTELIQNEMTAANITKEIKALQTDKNKQKLVKNYEILWQKLGNKGASERAAKIIAQNN